MVSSILILIFLKIGLLRIKLIIQSLCKVVTIYKDRSDAFIIHEQMFPEFSSLPVCSAAAAPSCRLCTSLALEKHTMSAPMLIFH